MLVEVVVARVPIGGCEAWEGELGGNVELAEADVVEAGGSDKRLLHRGQTIAML